MTTLDVGLGQDHILSSSVFSMPIIASVCSPCRTSKVNSKWLIKLTVPHDVDHPKGVNI
jgi:hypothetical protein